MELILANSAGSKKRARQAIKRNKHNSQLRTRLRTFIKKTIHAIDSKEKELANNHFTALKTLIDQAVSKGLLHKNNAARKKSRLVSHIKNI